MYIELSLHLQYAVAFIFSGLDIAVLLVLIGGIEVDQVAVLIGLRILDQVLVLLEGEILTLDVLQQGELSRTVVELLVGQHTILDKELQAVPLLLELRTVVLEDLLQAVGHLLRDVT